MKRKKKKQNNNKQEIRHKRKAFLKKLKQVAACLGDASVFSLLNEEDYVILFHCRIRPFKIIRTDNEKHIKSKSLRLMNQNLSHLLHHAFITIKECETKLSLYDFSVYAETLHSIWRNLGVEQTEKSKAFRAAFPLFNNNFISIRADVNIEIGKRMEMLAWFYSNFTHFVIRFEKKEIEKALSVRDQTPFFNNCLIELQKAETELFDIDGHKRTIYRLFLNSNQQIIPLILTPGKLGINSVMQDYPLKVFIQQHALKRMQERLGTKFIFFSYLYIVPAILGKPILIENNTSCLFPLCHQKIRLGYLKADIVGDKLLIRTFLFLTNNGTPEGKKLHKLLGLQKADKKYIGIDKLRTFILSDIKNDEKLKSLFLCSKLWRLVSIR
jgi:hypothetical protein